MQSNENLGFPLSHLPDHKGGGGRKKKDDTARELEQMKTSRADEQTQAVYICGQCYKEILLKPSDNIRCRTCGHRILYKKRKGDIPAMYEAR